MTFISIVLVLLVTVIALDVLALTGRTPDTHAEKTQFGEYSA